VRTIQQESGAEGAEKGVASIKCCASPNINPDASHVEMTGLPPPPPVPKRWVPHRKAEVVSAVSRGFLSLDDALERYALSIEEYLVWQRSVDLFGLSGLRVNKAQQDRLSVPNREATHRKIKSRSHLAFHPTGSE
jgi:hypothetical protein